MIDTDTAFGPSPLDTLVPMFELLRDRVAAMGDKAKADATAEWRKRGLPSVHPDHIAEDAGWELYTAIEKLLCKHEPPADKAERDATLARFRAVFAKPHEKFLALKAMELYGLRPGHPMTTIGRDQSIRWLINNLDEWWPMDQIATVDSSPPASTDPVVSDRILTDVPEPGLENVPQGTVAAIKKWVDGDPEKARLAYRAEVYRKGNRARTSLLSLLSALLVEPDTQNDGEGVGESLEESAPSLSLVKDPPSVTVIPDGYRFVTAVGPAGETWAGTIRAEDLDDLIGED